MFIVIPETTPVETMTIAAHLGGRDLSMMFALIGRIKPALIPGKRWGLFATARTEAALLRKKRSLERDRGSEEFAIVPIQHGFDPYP